MSPNPVCRSHNVALFFGISLDLKCVLAGVKVGVAFMRNRIHRSIGFSGLFRSSITAPSNRYLSLVFEYYGVTDYPDLCSET